MCVRVFSEAMDGERGSEMVNDGSINLNPTEPVVDLTGQVHQLPCCIKYNGPCSVSHYFKPKQAGIEVEGLTVEEAYFRGRKLQGATILPSGRVFWLCLGKEEPRQSKTY
ncbi:hypothetical protein L1049_019658 [Liquidambar formosana]|uniref:Uncharacterized protein n=1 Tax=Liquidambar formosana TaxID=63359 RepID=A0AAP0SCW7_LIQFO